tara:strand:+ start:195 stop:812 length:618 start_codon:yes stop_codon:yes gene_type:complete
MVETNISISNKSLVKCGATTITSFTEGSHEANVSATMYETTKKGLLYYTFWNFAIKKSLLNLLNETPLDKNFTYAHSLPGDIIRIKAIFDEGGYYQEDYKIEGQKVYSNSAIVFLEYVQDMDEQYFPVFFIETLVAKLAYEINEAITGIGSLQDRLLNDFNIKLRAARIADGQENPPVNVMPAGRLIEAHLGANSSVAGNLRHSN